MIEPSAAQMGVGLGNVDANVVPLHKIPDGPALGGEQQFWPLVEPSKSFFGRSQARRLYGEEPVAVADTNQIVGEMMDGQGMNNIRLSMPGGEDTRDPSQGGMLLNGSQGFGAMQGTFNNPPFAQKTDLPGPGYASVDPNMPNPAPVGTDSLSLGGVGGSMLQRAVAAPTPGMPSSAVAGMGIHGAGVPESGLGGVMLNPGGLAEDMQKSSEQSKISGLWGALEEGDEMMSSIPTGLLDDLDLGVLDAGDLAGVSFFGAQEGQGGSRFSLWATPYDASSGGQNMERQAPRSYSGVSPSYQEQGSYVFGGVGPEGVHSNGGMEDPLGKGHHPGNLGEKTQNENIDLNAMFGGLAPNAPWDEGQKEPPVPVEVIARDLLIGTMFSEGDLDMKLRELLWDLSRKEAAILVETARPQLMSTDRNSLREVGPFLHSIIQMARLRAQRQASQPIAPDHGKIGAEAPKSSLDNRNGNELPLKVMCVLLEDLCSGTCIEGVTLENQHFASLTGLSYQDAITVLRAGRAKLSKIQHQDVRNASSVLNSILVTAKEDWKRAKKGGAPPPSMPPHADVGLPKAAVPVNPALLSGPSPGLGGMAGINGTGSSHLLGVQGPGGNQGLGGHSQATLGVQKDLGAQGPPGVQGAPGPELHTSVKKMIRELASQTCFEESDFERAHLSLLAGMQPGVACNVLRNVKARLAKTKRRDHRSPSAFLLGALSSAARSAVYGPNGEH
mmetsp:Transcript_48557/g.75819  ORF Transcript_48557/g.75819 Transcript_48557/m.75819 type:complete len:727 (+) Transcript_48557:1-2181(+)